MSDRDKEGAVSQATGAVGTTRTSMGVPPKRYLLGLSPELRNRIWEYVVIEDHEIYLAPLATYSKDEKPETGTQLAITQACSQTRAETLRMC